MSLAEKKPYHHGHLREALLAATEAALDELPLEDVSLREIARRAGVSHAAPKHHFGSLGGLLAEVAARGFQIFSDGMATAKSRVPAEDHDAQIRAAIRAYLRFATAHRPAYGLMFGKRAELEYTPSLMAGYQRAWSELEGDVALIVGPARAPNAALMVWSCCHGLAMLMLDAKLPPHLNPDAAIEAIATMVLAGLKSDA